MREVGAVFGGEGNGGVIEPKVGYVRDSFVGMAYIFAGLTTRTGTLADWADSMPRYVIVKDKLTCPRDRADAACRALEMRYSDATASRGDGLQARLVGSLGPGSREQHRADPAHHRGGADARSGRRIVC